MPEIKQWEPIVPIAPTYPGVYIQEEKSSVHTITGVPTSVAAFVGYATQGPVNKAVHITSWSDYVRVYGPLNPDLEMSYAVYLFFSNGGSAAEIVRAGASDHRGKVPSWKIRCDCSNTYPRCLPLLASPTG